MDELARRLCAAYMSIQMGISLSHCYTAYMKDRPVGGYWSQVAEKITEEHGGLLGLISELLG